MAQSKSSVQEFQTSWNKTLNWAKGQGISQPAIYSVYQLDSKRLLSGYYPMSEAERTRALLASANPNNVTPLPTDTPANPITGFFHNVMHDATNIFTGLQPTKLIPSIFDGVKNTVEHPDWVLNPEKNTIAQWIPGVAVIGEAMQGGLSNVLSHPLVSFLDVLPLADTGVGLLAKAGMGAGIAERAGIPAELLGRSRLLGQDAQNGIGALSLARKLVGNTPTKKMGIYKDAEGNTVHGTLTVHQRLKNYANTHMAGSDQANLAGHMMTLTSAASHELAGLSKEWDAAYSKLSPEQARLAYDIWAGLDKVLGGKSRESLLAEPSLPVEMKEFFSHTFEVQDYVQEKLLAAGDGGNVLMPDGTIEWRAATGVDNSVVVARTNYLNAVNSADAASKHADSLAANITKNDTVAGPAFEKMADLTKQVQGAIKGSLSEPGVRSALADRLRPTLPSADRWDRLNVNTDNIARLIGLKDGSQVTLTQARLINEIYGTGGLLEKIQAAYGSHDFDAMVRETRTLVKRFNNKSISPDRAIGDVMPSMGIGQAGRVQVSPVFAQTRTLADNLYQYAMGRKREEFALSKALKPLKTKTDALAKAQKFFDKAQRDHPAANWQPLSIALLNRHLAETEEGQVAVAKALADYKNQGKVTAETIDKFRKDPAQLIEIMQAYDKAASTSVFAGVLPADVVAKAEAETKDDIARLRAQGFEPRWIPNVTSADRGYESYDVHIQPLAHMTPDTAKSKLLDLNNTVFDLHAGFSKALFQSVQRDATAKFIDEYFIPGFGHKQSDLIPQLQKMYPALLGTGHATSEAEIASILEHEWGLTKFDPNSRFNISSKHIKGDDTIWVPRDMVKGLEETVSKSQFDLTGALPTATRVFRYSVLGYSPRFWAHITFGGTFLMALREPLAFKFLPDALKAMKDPEFRSMIHQRSTQIGADKPESLGARAFHQATGKTLVYHWGQHMMENLGLDPTKWTSWLKVIPQMTFKFTNFVTDMQRSLVYLDGAAKAEGRGIYTDPVTGVQEAMTDSRAQEEGMRAANRTMGHLSAMSPFEQNVMTTIMPFYGWTKHILTYVVQYPADHSYRAMFLSNLANMNSNEVSKGLYTRIQNLFFLGSPDSAGNVSALDVRALNPLRDVANYATIGGFISALNPVISAPFTMVDPQVIFGSNTLYPNVSYNQLYGTKEASASGSLLGAAEQFVPELTTVDAALGLSQQYRTLQKSNPAAFTKLIFSSLNIPFANVQKINLKQIAAQQELDRYQQASTAATQAFDTGQFGPLGNVASVPNPLQTDLNIAPKDLEALYKQTLAQTGLPPSEVLPQLPTPAGL